MSTIINFFGVGVRYWICRIPREELDTLSKYRTNNALNWEDIFFDLHTLELFGYENWESFNVILEGSGWLTADRNWLEIKVGRKKRKVLTDEFLGKGLMFDLFNKEHTEWVYEPQEGTRDILLIQLETGLMAKYELTEEGVDLSQLIFELQPKWMEDLLGMNWVEGVRCNNGDSIKTKEDTLIRENRVKWINYEEE